MLPFLSIILRLSDTIPVPPPVPELNPDRPSVASSAEIVPKGFPQVEFGYRQTQSSGVVIRQFGDGPLFRIGLCEKFELRLSPGSYTDFRILGNSFRGQEDSSVGFKLRLKDGKSNSGLRSPSMAILGATSLPTGGRFYRHEELQPSVTGVAEFSIDDNNALTANVGYSFLNNDGDHFGQTLLDLTLGHSLAPKLGSFIEVYSTITPRSQGGTTTYGDFGLSYGWSRNIVLDAFAGTNIDSGPNIRYLGLGATVRF